MDMCFACIAAVLTYHSGWRIRSYKYKNCCVLCKNSCVNRNVWFANCLYCIKRWVIGQYASGYMGCRLFPVLYILLVHCHQYQIHCSMTILHTCTVCYGYITVGVGYTLSLRKSVNNKDILQLDTDISGLFPTLKI